MIKKKPKLCTGSLHAIHLAPRPRYIEETGRYVCPYCKRELKAAKNVGFLLPRHNTTGPAPKALVTITIKHIPGDCECEDALVVEDDGRAWTEGSWCDDDTQVEDARIAVDERRVHYLELGHPVKVIGRELLK